METKPAKDRRSDRNSGEGTGMENKKAEPGTCLAAGGHRERKGRGTGEEGQAEKQHAEAQKAA